MKATSSKVLVTIFSPELEKESIEIARQLREKNIATELYLNPKEKLDKQLKYADKKGIPYVIIVGPDEVRTKLVTFKNLAKKTQKTIPIFRAISLLTED